MPRGAVGVASAPLREESSEKTGARESESVGNVGSPVGTSAGPKLIRPSLGSATGVERSIPPSGIDTLSVNGRADIVKVTGEVTVGSGDAGSTGPGSGFVKTWEARNDTKKATEISEVYMLATTDGGKRAKRVSKE